MRKQKRDYKCLTITKRLQLEALLRRNVSKKEIAEFLGVHISTVYREIKRGLCKQRNYGQVRWLFSYLPLTMRN